MSLGEFIASRHQRSFPNHQIRRQSLRSRRWRRRNLSARLAHQRVHPAQSFLVLGGHEVADPSATFDSALTRMPPSIPSNLFSDSEEFTVAAALGDVLLPPNSRVPRRHPECHHNRNLASTRFRIDLRASYAERNPMRFRSTNYSPPMLPQSSSPSFIRPADHISDPSLIDDDASLPRSIVARRPQSVSLYHSQNRSPMRIWPGI